MSRRLVIVIEYACGFDQQQSLFEAMTQIRKGEKRLNRNNVKIMHVHAAVKSTAGQVLAIFDNLAGEKQMDMQLSAKILVVNYFNERVEKTDQVVITVDDVYVVWFAKMLQNYKALVSTTIPDGMYYEVTYNGGARETYLDAYKKFENVCIPD